MYWESSEVKQQEIDHLKYSVKFLSVWRSTLICLRFYDKTDELHNL